VLVSDIDPSRGRNGYSVVAKVDENVNAVPLHKTVAIGHFSLRVVALAPLFFADTCWYIMAKYNFGHARFLFLSIRNSGLLEFVVSRFPPAEFIQVGDEFEVVVTVVKAVELFF